MNYEMRKLKAVDLFPMVTIISKIGLKNIKPLIEDGTINTIVETAKNKKDEESNDKNSNDDALNKIGLSLFLELGDIVCGNIMKCQNDIFGLFASLCDVDADEIRNVDIDEFAELCITFLTKDELGDFMKAVSKYLK